MLDVRQPSSGQIIEKNDLISLPENMIGEVRADESGASGDQDFHLCLLVVLVLVDAQDTLGGLVVANGPGCLARKLTA